MTDHSPGTARTPSAYPTPSYLEETGMSGADNETPIGAIVRPRIRWAGVVWGLVLMVLGTGVLYIASAAERASAVHDWLRALNGGTAWALAIAVVGGIIVILALLGAIRSAQRRHEPAGRA
jgi:hypothetical protein